MLIHSLNEWMHEHWTYVYSDAIFSTPIISLADGVDTALKELEYIADRGAKIFLMRVAPVPTWQGRKSFALEEYDPFWEEVARRDIVVGMHPVTTATRATRTSGRASAPRCSRSSPRARRRSRR
ncbi:MAG: hypothetical protein U0W40_03725 [Acidimicrobiia bacterium]